MSEPNLPSHEPQNPANTLPFEPGEPASDNSDLCTCGRSAPRGFDSNQYIYALGRIDVRFPSLGIEREFQQRQRLLKDVNSHSKREGLHCCLKENQHLARAVTYIFSVDGIPAYVLIPTSSQILSALVDALSQKDEPAWDLVIGQRAGFAPQTISGGLLLPMVSCDQIYSFTLSEHTKTLTEMVSPVLGAGKIKQDDFEGLSQELFREIALSPDNIGGSDAHRALNYLLVQHPGIFIAAAERSKNSFLEGVETRHVTTPGGRLIVTVIFNFINRTTGVSERLFTRVDVTEKWPFIADVTHGAASPLGLQRFVNYSEEM